MKCWDANLQSTPTKLCISFYVFIINVYAYTNALANLLGANNRNHGPVRFQLMERTWLGEKISFRHFALLCVVCEQARTLLQYISESILIYDEISLCILYSRFTIQNGLLPVRPNPFTSLCMSKLTGESCSCNGMKVDQ